MGEEGLDLFAEAGVAGAAFLEEAGTIGLGEGPPFFAMEFVDGVSISEYVSGPGRQARRTTREIVTLVALVADAIEHAHLRGVVHRDLKPANILVTPDGQPKVLDFGVARALEQDARLTSMRTDVGQLIGTLAYMSPEQITGGTGDAGAIDQRGDVYSLGVILYELLTGRLPHDVRGSSLAHAAQRIMSEDPPRMIALRRELRGDIETIVRKALEKDVGRRYQSAAAFAADLRHYLNSEPIAARPATTLYQLRKFAQRNRALVAGVVLAVGALAIGATVSTILAINENRLRHEADQSKAEAQRNSYRLALAAADATSATDPVKALAHLDAAPPALRGWECRYVRSRLDPVRASIAGDRPEDGSAIAVGPHGEPFGAVVRAVALQVIDLVAERVVTSCAGPLTRPRLSDDGSVIAAIERPVSSEADRDRGPVVVFDSTGRERWRTPETCVEYGLSPDGLTVALQTPDCDVRIYRVGHQSPVMNRRISSGTGRARFSFHHGSTYVGVLWMKNGGSVFFSVFDIQTGRELAGDTPPPGDIGAFNVELDADRVASPFQRAIRIDDRATGRPLQTLSGHMSFPSTFALAPDGLRLASASSDLTLRVWNIATVACTTVTATDHEITQQRWMPDGRAVLAAQEDASAKIISVEAQSEMVLHHSTYVYHALFSPDGKYVASGGWNSEVKLWEAATGRLVATPSEGWLKGAPSPAIVGFTPHSTELVVDTAHGIYRWTLEALARGDTTPRISPPIDFFPDTMATLTPAARRTRGDGGQVTAPSPDGTTFVNVDDLPDLSVLDAAGKTLRTFHPSREQLRAVAFSPDGATIAAGGNDTRIYLLDAATGAVRLTLAGHRGTIYTLAFSPDGKRLASGGNDNTIIIWDPAAGEPLLELHRHTAYVHAVSFSPDGTRLVSASGDGTVRIWGKKP